MIALNQVCNGHKDGNTLEFHLRPSEVNTSLVTAMPATYHFHSLSVNPIYNCLWAALFEEVLWVVQHWIQFPSGLWSVDVSFASSVVYFHLSLAPVAQLLRWALPIPTSFIFLPLFAPSSLRERSRQHRSACNKLHVLLCSRFTCFQAKSEGTVVNWIRKLWTSELSGVIGNMSCYLHAIFFCICPISPAWLSRHLLHFCDTSRLSIQPV